MQGTTIHTTMPYTDVVTVQWNLDLFFPIPKTVQTQYPKKGQLGTDMVEYRDGIPKKQLGTDMMRDRNNIQTQKQFGTIMLSENKNK